MKIKKTFLELTKFTIPFGYEDSIVPFINKTINKKLIKDSVGNYYIEIGDSETLFTTHLDTYSNEMEKVNHVIDGDIIATDGNTILGGDNKNGTTILMYMITKNIPGTYYFFIGEEPLSSGGLYGSGNILMENEKFFKKFKRAIAFDRKQKGSVVIRQMARKCCSDDFANSLINEFDINGMTFKQDPEAYYTDTATFLDIIPEITNISAGGWGEHTKNEYTDISYVKKIAKVACKIKWEELPTTRIPKVSVKQDHDIDKFYNTSDIKESNQTFEKVDYLLTMFGYKCLNIEEFKPNQNMLFSHWHKDSEIYIKIIKNIITLNDKKLNSYKELRELFNVSFDDIVNIENLFYQIIELDKKEIPPIEIDNILSKYHMDSDDFIDFIKNTNILDEYITFVNNKFIVNI